MANRSYLFSTPAIPSPSGDLPKPIRGISEYNWDIPWVHQVLVSVNTQRCASAIWNAQIGIVGDYDAGVERLDRMVQRLTSLGKLTGDTAEEAQKALDFLRQDKSRQRYFFLETGEILSIYGDDVERYAADVLSEIESIRDEIDELPDKHGFDAFWSHVLYFSFPQ